MELTPEQKVIIGHPFAKKEIVRIVAFAGTGKTSTLIEVAKHHKDLNFLYICYNKAIQLDAEQKFGGNTVCRTSHSLAYGFVGYKYRSKLTGKIRAKTVYEYFDKTTEYSIIVPALTTMSKWCVSADGAITNDHIPNMGGSPPDAQMKNEIIAFAKRIWEEMIKIPAGLSMTHDGYFKLWQLSKPRLNKYDIILLDEAQDANPALVDILCNQTSGLVFVGDPHQSIYQWRGAINAMEEIPCDFTYVLTKSFRFGEETAALASTLLQKTKDEKRKVIGSEKETNIRSIEDNEIRTILCRTNAKLFWAASQLYDQNISIDFVGGIQNYNFKQILDACTLKFDPKGYILDFYIKTFTSYDQLKVLSEKAEDLDMLQICKIVDEYGMRCFEIVDELTRNSGNRNAHVQLTTAHKSKGLEWDNVVLASDFSDIREGINEQEINLFYVALTRAQKALQINSQLKVFLTEGVLPAVSLDNI